jgi:triacylglycerol lipase
MFRRLLSVNRRLQILATIAACLSLTACVGISAAQLNSLGSKLTPVDINFAELKTYAERSRAAYGAKPVIKAKYPKTIRISSPGDTGVLYFLERDDKAKTQIITVRGTADQKNFSEDLDITVRTDRQADIPVDAGFDRAARAVYSDAKSHLKRDYKTYVTGHSLGGAVAALVTIYAIEDGFMVERVITFGQPRFTTATGVQRLRLPLIRVVDENDMVPMLPPATATDPKFGPYEHVGPEVILLQGQYYVYLPAHDATRIDVGEFWRTIGIADLPDHKIDHYVNRIADKINGAVEVTYNQREQYVGPQTDKLQPALN